MGKQVTEVEEGVRKLAAKAGNFESQRKDAFWFYEDQAAPRGKAEGCHGALVLCEGGWSQEGEPHTSWG